ncbi:hypothetical protein DKR98_25655 [Salmonella enterica subsp. enterica serovar Kentucky]|nr:hypothetical protein [Salmonella enterica subsp. enterica serovar Kentucky]
MSAGLAEGQRRSYMGDGSLREPSPIRQGIGGEPSRIKIGTLKGPPIFSWTVQQLRGDVAKK